MSEKNPTPQSPLDPGIARRKPISWTKLFISAVVILSLFIVGWFFTSITDMKKSLGSPHQAYYQNASIEEVKNRWTVVQPLVDRNQAYDIGVSVWVRGPKGSDDSNNALETPLFSDIVFRDLHTTDALKSTIVTLKVPNTRFREENLTNFDLRASFVLLPSSSSPLDRLKNISTWKPASINISPVRTWPFPLNSQNNAEKNMIDDAIEAFGISEPLIQFHTIRSKCPSIANTDDDDDDDEDGDDVDDESGDSPASTTPDANDIMAAFKFNVLQTTIGKPALKAHPYIVTRTHLRLVDEERLYNRKLYNKAHNNLKQKSCGQSMNNVAQPSEYMCSRDFRTNGNFETRLEIDTSDRTTLPTDEAELAKAIAKGVGSEWLYAPYLSVYDHGAGPKDLKPIEVNREKNCESINSDAEYTEVEWKVSFSSISPFMLQFADIAAPRLQKDTMNQSEYKVAEAHANAELLNGLHGHRFNEDAHPRRSIVLSIITSTLKFIVSILDIIYWYTRTTTYSFSILGIGLTGASGLLASIVAFGLGLMKAEDTKWWSAIWGHLIGLLLNPSPLLQLKTVLRLEFGSNGWVPRILRLPATHKERASERLEAQVSWLIRGGICISVLAVYLFLNPRNIMLIAPLHPAPSPEDLKDVTKWTQLVDAMSISGFLLQRLFNQHSKLFSGKYKSAVCIVAVRAILTLTAYVPHVAGRLDARPGFSLHEGMSTILTFWMAWHAWVFKSVPRDVEDLDSE
ncbi:hypothetical protein BT96DRAFT_1024841 [Gymnopus androsaceus JB14]|uniref:Cleft lip and palate transmembrane 1 n=1 Tax=Gymnopus androsaceus JB14 TaxID=1447944 RepID=A0A6A4GWQ7_9AGAR|nr:hypothetical protein BT96DRAFT_1024841 [Gymnopus androsaceus JB14]